MLACMPAPQARAVAAAATAHACLASIARERDDGDRPAGRGVRASVHAWPRRVPQTAQAWPWRPVRCAARRLGSIIVEWSLPRLECASSGGQDACTVADARAFCMSL